MSVFKSYRKYKEGKRFVKRGIGRLNDHRHERCGHRELDFIGIARLDRIVKIAAIKADNDVLAVLFNQDLVIEAARYGNRAELERVLAEGAAKSGLCLTHALFLGNEHRSFESAAELVGVYLNENLVGLGNKAVVIDILLVDKTGEEADIANLEIIVLSCGTYGDGIVAVVEQLDKLGKRFAGQNELAS